MKKLDTTLSQEVDYPSLPLRQFIERVREIKGSDKEALQVVNKAIFVTKNQLEMLKKLKKDIKHI